MTRHDAQQRAAVIAMVLRQLASWGISRPETDEEWYQLAQNVEDNALEPWCCPLCQEIDCDDDCPLFGYRLNEYEESDIEHEKADLP